jgi:hypothetical protein
MIKRAVDSASAVKVSRAITVALESSQGDIPERGSIM